MIYNTNTEEVEVVDNQEVKSEAHGAGPKTAQKISGYNPDIIITGNGPGGNAVSVLSRINVKVFTGAINMTVEEAYRSYNVGELSAFN